MITYRKKHLNALDERTQLLTEVVKHLHSIKLFAYEPMFEERIASKRKEEAGWVMRMSTCNAIADAIGVCMPAVAAVGESLRLWPVRVCVSKKKDHG
jgi:ABC-type bacteriocin/lantibiotic exporter with double-glycine peptidase domain